MTIRDDESIEITLPPIDNFTNRKEIRDFLLTKWINEDCKTKFRYFVETIADKRIYLERPGRLNKGCDFVIYIEDYLLWQNDNDKPPNHEFLLNDLIIKRRNLNDDQWDQLLQAIKDIFMVKPYPIAYGNTINLPEVGLTYEIVLKLTRWFFIEQDITYWAKSGREMLYNTILDLK